MAKFHITKKGEPGVCHAAYSCPLGGDEAHFSTKDEARTHYEKKMTAELLPRGTHINAGKRELNQLAKFTSDKDILEKIVLEGSDTTFKALAKNPNVEKAHLLEAYSLTESDAAKAALTMHKNFPVSGMTPEEFARVGATKSWADKDFFGDNSIGDEHIAAAVAYSQQATGYQEKSVGSSTIREALANPNNRVSQEKLIELAEASEPNLAAALQSGRYPTDRIANLPKDRVYWGTIGRQKTPEALKGYASWAIANQADDAYNAEYVASAIARNEHTSAETLDRLASNGLGEEQVWSHKNTSEATKKTIEARNPRVASKAKVDMLDRQLEGKLKETITIKNRTARPFGGNRGIADVTIQVDREKVKAMGLTPTDVATIFDARRFNAGFRYNEDTGVIQASWDSTD